VQALLNAIKEFVDNPENEDKSLSAFLQSVSLLTSAEDDKDTDRDKVTMMTIHMAKGLEFKYVYIVGLEEDLVSLADDAHQPGRPGEERRLFYVAITRAEKKLTLSYAETRYQYGRLKNCEPSRFLKEIDNDYLRTNHSLSNREAYVNSFVRNLTPRKPHR
jgi:DNA helicase-2/ATP-dependent DNA helicase PcrA